MDEGVKAVIAFFGVVGILVFLVFLSVHNTNVSKDCGQYSNIREAQMTWLSPEELAMYEMKGKFRCGLEFGYEDEIRDVSDAHLIWLLEREGKTTAEAERMVADLRELYGEPLR